MGQASGVIVSAKHGVLVVPKTPEIIGYFQPDKSVTVDGNEMVVVPHREDATLLLRNLGYAVPAPVMTQYNWAGGTPFAVQKRTVAMLTMNKRAYVLNGMGTGKTKAALWAWHYLFSKGMAKKLLVVAPLSTLNFTWSREVFQTLPGVKVQVLHGDRARRLKRLADPDASVFVVNHDGLLSIQEHLKDTGIDTMVIDELAVYRNPSAARTKLARKVAATMKWAWGMTGSPTPNEPTDAWAQCTILTPDTVPKYFNRFREEVMFKVSQFQWKPKTGALERVFEVMQPAVRFTLDDVLELPDLVERQVDVEMGPKQAKVYKQMEAAAHTLIAGHEITAMNAGVVLNKLLQISLGFVYSREKEVVTLDNEERLNAIVGLVNSTDKKVIVFVPFVHALEAVTARLTSEGYDVRAVHGGTPKGERDTIFNLFQSTGSVKVLVAHPQCMAHGLTLTAADTIIWAAPITSLEIFLQANARIRRIGQRNKQQIIMLQATKVEKKAYARLRAKEQVMNLLLDMFAEGSA